MESLQSLLSPKSNIRSSVAQAETAIKLMRANGYNDQADLFESQIKDAIVTKNSNAFSGNVTQLFAFQKKAAVPTPKASEKVKASEYGADELAMRIQDAIAMADERGIDLPNSDLSRLSSLAAQGDTKKASEQLSKISSFIEKSLEVQTEESKKPQVLADGTQIEIGEKSGTRYMGGQPISKGAINSDVFNSMNKKNIAASEQKASAEGLPFIPDLRYQTSQAEGVQFRPDVYAQPIKEDQAGIEKKAEMLRKAGEAFRSGKTQEAVILLNAAGGNGMFGIAGESDLERMFGAMPQGEPTPTEPKSDATQQNQPTQSSSLPSSVNLKGKTINRPEGWSDEKWSGYVDHVNRNQ